MRLEIVKPIVIPQEILDRAKQIEMEYEAIGRSEQIDLPTLVRIGKYGSVSLTDVIRCMIARRKCVYISTEQGIVIAFIKDVIEQLPKYTVRNSLPLQELASKIWETLRSRWDCIFQEENCMNVLRVLRDETDCFWEEALKWNGVRQKMLTLRFVVNPNSDFLRQFA